MLPCGLASPTISFISAGVSLKSKIAKFSFSRSERLVWDDDDVLLDQEAQADLGRGLAMRFADAAEHGVAGDPAARHRAVGGHRKTALPARRDGGRLVEIGCHSIWSLTSGSVASSHGLLHELEA